MNLSSDSWPCIRYSGMLIRIRFWLALLFLGPSNLRSRPSRNFKFAEMSRNLALDPRKRNVRLYDNEGTLLGGLHLADHSGITNCNFYAWCAVFLVVDGQWSIFHLERDGSTGRVIRSNQQLLHDGAFVVLDTGNFLSTSENSFIVFTDTSLSSWGAYSGPFDRRNGSSACVITKPEFIP